MLRRFRTTKKSMMAEVKDGFVVGLLWNAPWLFIAIATFFGSAVGPSGGVAMGFGFLILVGVNLLAIFVLYYRNFSANAWKGFGLAVALTILIVPILCGAVVQEMPI
ncbi:MAG: hypothetical protein ACI97A_003942 [Planctomycetota bacterium]|jgi:hypothetical protein